MRPTRSLIRPLAGPLIAPLANLAARANLTPLRRSAVPEDLSTVTSIGTEAPASAADMDPDDIDGIWSAVERLYRWGQHPAIGICVRRDGHVVLDRAIGHASGNGPEHRDRSRGSDGVGVDAVPVTTDSPFCIASGSKAITAMLIHLLDEQGEIHVDDRVADYVPEFARHGKGDITLNHVLSHRAGVPNIPSEVLDIERINDRDFILEVLCDAEPRWRPGRSVAYHAVSGGYILAEVLQRVTGQDVRTFLAEQILDPLGFQWNNYGVAPEHVGKVVTDHTTGVPVLPPLSQVFVRALGVPVEQVTQTLNDPRFLTAIVPAANIVTTANELSRFYELLRLGGELDGKRVMQARTIRRAITEQSYLEFDFTLGFPFRYGMGFMLGAEKVSLYGFNTQHAFGHLGFTNVFGWADPERRLSVSLLTSGKPVLGPHLLDLYNVVWNITRSAPADGLEDSPLHHT